MTKLDLKKTGRISARISGKLRARIDAINEKHGTSDVRLAEDALTALADYVELQGRYERPVRMVRASAGARADYGINEEREDPLMRRLHELVGAETERRLKERGGR